MHKALVALLLPFAAHAATYDVGPGQPLASIGAAPWATLQPGDTVRIHYRSTPYREKWRPGNRRRQRVGLFECADVQGALGQLAAAVAGARAATWGRRKKGVQGGGRITFPPDRHESTSSGWQLLDFL